MLKYQDATNSRNASVDMSLQALRDHSTEQTKNAEKLTTQLFKHNEQITELSTALQETRTNLNILNESLNQQLLTVTNNLSKLQEIELESNKIFKNFNEALYGNDESKGVVMEMLKVTDLEKNYADLLTMVEALGVHLNSLENTDGNAAVIATTGFLLFMRIRQEKRLKKRIIKTVPLIGSGGTNFFGKAGGDGGDDPIKPNELGKSGHRNDLDQTPSLEIILEKLAQMKMKIKTKTQSEIQTNLSLVEKMKQENITIINKRAEILQGASNFKHTIIENMKKSIEFQNKIPRPNTNLIEINFQAQKTIEENFIQQQNSNIETTQLVQQSLSDLTSAITGDSVFLQFFS